MNKQELIDAVLKLTSPRNIRMAEDYDQRVSMEEDFNVGDQYGHTEDCFSAGMDIGEAQAILNVVEFIENNIS